MSKYTPIGKIKLNPANPRIIRDAEYRDLVRSIAQFPKMLYKRGVVVDGNLMALGGNQRWRSILDILKMPESDLQALTAKQPDAYTLWEVLREKKAVPEQWIVDGSDFTEEEIRRFIIVDNIQKGEHDWDALANGWDQDELAEWGLRVPGWGEGKQEAQEDEFEIPDEIKTDIVLGDLFEIGPHRLLCGDSTVEADVARLMDGAKADIVFTDPDYSMDVDALFKCYENTKETYLKASLWVCADKQAVRLANYDIEKFSSFFIHDFKVPTLISNKRAMQRHNMICVFGSAAIHNRKDGFTTIVSIATERTLESHKVTRMAKRIGLPAAFIEHFTEQGELILDIFGHSGSTMVAAHQLNRRCNMIEIEPKFCQCIIDRMLKNDPGIEITKNGKEYLHNSLETCNLAVI